MKAVLAVYAALPLLGQQQSSQSPPPYFDEPKFIVSGVADPSQRGGHGSDPVLRSAESLAKATAALGTGNAADTSPLEAVRQYQRAAELDPSEPNLFNWGAELLTHRATDQAVEVFLNGHRLFPRSTRTLLGLAVALYSRGSYDQAARSFFEAADLDPGDPAPYMFLGKISSGAITGSDGYAKRLERFARLDPDNAWANYYYAATLKRTSPKARALLEKAVRLNPKLGEAFLLLGNGYADEGNFSKAILDYQSAIAASPQIEETHYRLAMAYRKTGEIDKSQKELDLYQEMSRQSQQKFERERSEIQEFVFEMKH
ncbi:MAG: tetratricopeptide repeat protein [Bryobacteraceae bacterium]